MLTLSSDSLVETLIDDFEAATSQTEVSILNQRVVALNNKVPFDNAQWGVLMHYSQIALARVGD